MAKKILIVEDNRPMSQAMESKLKKAGFETDIAHDGDEALAMIKENDFDLLLVDLIMPKLDGFTLIAELKKKGNKTPIIVVSNLGQEEDESRAKDLEVDDYLIKTNVTLEEIVDRVEETLG